MNNEELIKKIKQNIALENLKTDLRSNHILEENKIWRKLHMKKKIAAFLCTCFIIISGVVFAKNYEIIMQKWRGMGSGLDKAVENGYIAETNMNFLDSNTVASNEEKGTVIEDVSVEAKIDDFVMDDVNLSTTITLKINENLNDMFNFENLHNVMIDDLIITDENNVIIYHGNEDCLRKYCKEHNLSYDIDGDDDNIYNCGVETFPQNIEKETIQLQYNIYSGGMANFPRSKKLYFEFTKLILSEEYTLNIDDANKLIINGNWKMEVDVPEKMYNRTTESYKVTSVSSKDINVYKASVSDTGFELGLVASNIEKPNFSDSEIREIFKKAETLNEDYENGRISKEEAEKIRDKAYEFLDSNPIITFTGPNPKNKDRELTHIENENEEKFKCSSSPGRRAKSEYLEGNRYGFYETFEMTKYDATDKIKVILILKDKEPVTIELEKVK